MIKESESALTRVFADVGRRETSMHLRGLMARNLRRPLLPCRGLRSGIFEQRKAQNPRRIALLDWLIKELLERFPHGLEFQCCEKLSPTSQYAARKVAEERQIKDFVAVLYIDYYNDPTPRYQTHIGTATIKECIEALGETQWST